MTAAARHCQRRVRAVSEGSLRSVPQALEEAIQAAVRLGFAEAQAGPGRQTNRL